MQYAIADIHGCLKELKELLALIDLREEDTLYVLGDMVDRGPDPIGVLRLLMGMPNAVPLIGNHEFMMMTVLRRLLVEVTAENAENYLSTDDLMSYSNWMANGGDTTIKAFRRLDREEQAEILDYLGDCSLFEETEAGGRPYLMVHAGLEPFDPAKEPEDYELSELLFKAPDLTEPYYDDRYVVTGHRPTFTYGGGDKILRQKGHIAIDCGCCFGHKLGCIRLDDGKEYYVKSKTDCVSG